MHCELQDLEEKKADALKLLDGLCKEADLKKREWDITISKLKDLNTEIEEKEDYLDELRDRVELKTSEFDELKREHGKEMKELELKMSSFNRRISSQMEELKSLKEKTKIS